MRLFIAEKPDLAKAIAEGLNGEYNKNLPKNCGYMQRGQDYITWAFGHIMELLEPHEYDEKYKTWSFENLPIVVTQFRHKAIKDKESQLKIILRLIKDEKIKQIVHCGDADDEGQILIDEILLYSQTQKPVYRCLINDITPQAVRKEIANMRPNSEFKNMSERGFARSFADWVVGLNLTRAYTLANRAKGGEGVVTVGRVQTPILGLIVARDLENDEFKSIDYYVLNADFDINGISIAASLKTEEKILSPDEANAIKDFCQNKQAMLNLSSQDKKEYPPLPYNLLILQAEASKAYGYSPSKTLEITQNLREKHKAISYNRSDCQYLPESLYNEAPNIIDALKANFSDDIGQNNANLGIKSKAFDDSKLSAHYGIVPTETRLNLANLSNEEKVIYTLICKRFLMQFYEPREFISYLLNFKVDKYDFNTSFSKTTKAGFAEFFRKSSDEENEKEANFDIKALKNGDLATIKQIEVKKLQTKPRPRYTMTTLLKDLNSVAKYVKDERIKKLLLEKDKDKKGESGGIGTPATRSDMIEKLIKQGYIEVSNDKKQNIKSTPRGKELIKSVSPILSQPDMTALWFEYQKAIEKGEVSKEAFLKSVYNTVSTEIDKIKSGNFSLGSVERIKCPQCSGFLIKRKGVKGFFYGCSNFKQGCKFICNADKKGRPDMQKALNRIMTSALKAMEKGQ